MSTVYHLHSDYEQVRQKLTKRSDEIFHQYLAVSAVLTKHWSEKLTPSEFQILIFVLGRTMLYRKRAEVISKSHLLNGIPGVCSPCGASQNTIDKAVSGLSDKDYLVLHAFREGSRESTSRIYELNVERILSEFDLSGVQRMASRFNQKGAEPPPKFGGGVSQNLGYITSLLRNDNTSTNVDVSAAPQPTRQAAGLRIPRTGSRKQVEVDCNKGNPATTIAAIQERFAINRANRAAKAAKLGPKKWTTQELQALLDSAAERAGEANGVKYPRIVVVAKNLNVLHKRMLDAKVKDPLDCFTWIIQNWSTVANANRRSKAQQFRTTQKATSEMSTAPNFNDLAFRFPYFLAFYNQREHGQQVTAATEKREKQQRAVNTRKRTEAMTARKDAARELDLRKEAEREDEDQEIRRLVRRPVKVDLEDDDEIPQFKERVWGQQ